MSVWIWWWGTCLVIVFFRTPAKSLACLLTARQGDKGGIELAVKWSLARGRDGTQGWGLWIVHEVTTTSVGQWVSRALPQGN